MEINKPRSIEKNILQSCKLFFTANHHHTSVDKRRIRVHVGPWVILYKQTGICKRNICLTFSKKGKSSMLLDMYGMYMYLVSEKQPSEATSYHRLTNIQSRQPGHLHNTYIGTYTAGCNGWVVSASDYPWTTHHRSMGLSPTLWSWW